MSKLMVSAFLAVISLLRHIGLVKTQTEQRSLHVTKDPISEKLRSRLHPVVLEFQAIIEDDPDLYMAFHQMFEQIPNEPPYDLNPAGRPQVRDYHEMLRVIDSIFTRAPEFGDGEKTTVPFPLCTIFNWPMNTSAGRGAFTSKKVNDQLKKILDTWGEFLSSPESRHVLTTDEGGWFSPEASKSIPNFIETYECNPEKEYYGFSSWDDFFTRRFRPGSRPIACPDSMNVITNACESVAYKISTNVQEFDSFWIKGEPYSLSHMLNHDPLSMQFIGGTIYQAYLSAYNYHRWHSPVDGTIVKMVHIPGTFFAISPATSFEAGNPDVSAPTRSQAFTTHVATRLLIFIQADNPKIGLICLVMVGMVEVSSCEATVKLGDHVKKGEQLGMFHFGGSTYFIRRPEVHTVAEYASSMHWLNSRMKFE